MAALDFPPGTTVGQQFSAANGVVYTWNGTLWLANAGSGAVTVSDTPPSNPVANQLWFNSLLGQTFIYYNDGNTTQWVPASPVPTSVVIPGTLTLYSEALGTGSTAFLSVAFPATAKLVRLVWYMEVTPAADVSFGLRGSVGGVPDSTAAYHIHSIAQLATTVSGGTAFSQTSWSLGSGFQNWGSVDMQRPTVGFGEGHTITRTAAATRVQNLTGFETSTALTPFNGFYFTGSAGNLIVGSYVRCLVVV